MRKSQMVVGLALVEPVNFLDLSMLSYTFPDIPVPVP